MCVCKLFNSFCVNDVNVSPLCHLHMQTYLPVMKSGQNIMLRAFCDFQTHFIVSLLTSVSHLWRFSMYKMLLHRVLCGCVAIWILSARCNTATTCRVHSLFSVQFLILYFHLLLLMTQSDHFWMWRTKTPSGCETHLGWRCTLWELHDNGTYLFFTGSNDFNDKVKNHLINFKFSVLTFHYYFALKVIVINDWNPENGLIFMWMSTLLGGIISFVNFLSCASVGKSS